MKLRIALLIAMMASGVATAQDYPSKPVRIVTTSAGGGADMIARLTAQGLSNGLGQQVVVENRGGGLVPGEVVAKSPPDGYTLLVYNNAVWTAQFFQKVPYDTVKDFATVSWITKSPQVLLVHPSLPVKSVKDLIALAKSRPGELNHTSAPNGTISHINGELLKALGGVNIVRVAYRGGANDLPDLLSGEVQISFQGPATAMSLVKMGKSRALGVTSAQPSVLVPGAPPISATLPGFVTQTAYGVWAPAKTPDPVIKRLNQELVRFYTSEEAKQRIMAAGNEAVGSSADEFAAMIRADIANIDKLAKEGRLK